MIGTLRLLSLPCFALALAATLAFGQDRTTKPDGFRVLTANLRYGTANDGAHAWPKRSDLTLATLVAARPDVLGLQEALDFQVDAVREVFPHHVIVGEGRDGDNKGEWCALAIDARRFILRASGTFRLAPVDRVGEVGWDAALTRIATWAELSDRTQGGRTVRIINAHFDHRGERARLESARLIARWVGARPELPTILMGDLNAGETSAPLTALRESGYRDTFRVAHPDATEVGTGHGFRGGRTGAKIDHVLVDERVEVLDGWIDWTEEEGRYPSDHRFVGAVLR